MSYHYPEDQRKIQRRRAPVARGNAPERRIADRRKTEVKLVRKPQPMHRGVLWAAVLMVMVVSDSVFLDGAYRHMAIDWINGIAAGVRYWSDHLWDGKR